MNKDEIYLYENDFEYILYNIKSFFCLYFELQEKREFNQFVKKLVEAKGR